MERLIVREKGRWPIDFEMSIKDVIDMLQKAADQGWTDIDREFYGSSEDSDYWTIRHRPETDEEYNSRIEKFNRAKEISKESRRKDYEQLKKEFGDD